MADIDENQEWFDSGYGQSRAKIEQLEEDVADLEKRLVESSEAGIRERSELWGQISELKRTLRFFRSVIQSGEEWSEQCEVAYDKATGGKSV